MAQPKFAVESRSSNYCVVAFVTFMLYDFVLTFGQEVEYVWEQKVNLGKVLFLLNRYLPIIVLVVRMMTNVVATIPVKFCVPWLYVDTWLTLLSVFVIDLVLLLRTWAIWRRSKIILIFLGSLIGICMVSASAGNVYELLTVNAIPDEIHIRSCQYIFPVPEVVYTSVLGIIVYDFAIVTLTLVRILPALHKNQPTPFMTRFLRDGLLYFIGLFLAAMTNVIVIRVAPPPYAAAFFTFYRCLSVTFCSRIMLNLRGMLLRPSYNDEDDSAATNVSALAFGGEESITAPHATEAAEDPEVESVGPEEVMRSFSQP